MKQREGPISERDLIQQWNAQADEFNQWESLDSGEQLAWAQARAIAADCNKRPEPAPEPGIYRVKFIRTWFAKLETLVWATSKEAAIQAVEDEKHLSQIDTDDGHLDYSARKLDMNFDEIKLLLEEDPCLVDEIMVVDPMANSQLMSFDEFIHQVYFECL
jgi:hypothetical protein